MQSLVESNLVVGEIGLDRYFITKSDEAYTLQKMAFETILRFCRTLPRILNIHSRGAEGDVMELLVDYDVHHAILHRYSGPFKYLETIENRHYLVSVGPSLLSSKKTQDIVRRLPPELVLTESDGPSSFPGISRVSPLAVRLVLKKLAELWSASIDEAELRVDQNFESLLSRVTKAA